MKNFKAKKFIYFLGILSLVLSSCSNNDSEDSENSPSILIKKIVETDIGNGAFTVEYFYDGNRIIKETGKKEDNYIYEIKYSYTGDLLTKEEEINENGVTFIKDFVYEGNKLITTFENRTDANQYTTKTTYSYSAGAVSYERVDVANTKEVSNIRMGKLTYNNENLVKEETVAGQESATIVYAYDAKNNPYTNVSGFNLLLDNAELGYSRHNKLSTKRIFADYDLTYSNLYTYDKNDFPVKVVSVDKNGNTERIVQFFY